MTPILGKQWKARTRIVGFLNEESKCGKKAVGQLVIGPLNKLARSVRLYEHGHATRKQPGHSIIFTALRLCTNRLERNLYIQHQKKV